MNVNIIRGDTNQLEWDKLNKKDLLTTIINILNIDLKDATVSRELGETLVYLIQKNESKKSILEDLFSKNWLYPILWIRVK